MRGPLLMVVVVLMPAGLPAQKDKKDKKVPVLTKDGKLSHTLNVWEMQRDGLAAKGRWWEVKPDGSWVRTVTDVGATTTKGKLTKEQLAELAKDLETYALTTLPNQRDKRPPAGAMTYQVTYGTGLVVIRNVDTNGPLGKPDAKTVKGRYAGIIEALEKRVAGKKKSAGCTTRDR